MRLIYSSLLFIWVSLSIFQGAFILFCLTEAKQKKCWGSWHFSVVLQCCSYKKKTVKQANISVGFFCVKLWDLLEMYCQHIKYPVVFHDISYWIGFAAAGGGDASRERLWPCQWSRLVESVTEWERNVLLINIFLFLTLLLLLHKLTNEEPTNCSLPVYKNSCLWSESLLISTEFKYMFAQFRFVAHTSFHRC